MRDAFEIVAGRSNTWRRIDFHTAILRERPDLQGNPAYFPAEGENASIIIIGGEVFKAPLYPQDPYDHEIKILQLLKGRGLPVPEITYVGRSALFFGMTRMPGVVLGDFFETEMTPEQLQRLAIDIVDFVVGMANVAPARGNLRAYHGDLNTGNILVDPVTKKLPGIIDFGVLGYAEPKYLKRRIWGSSEMFDDMIDREFERRIGEITMSMPLKTAVGMVP